MSRSISASMLNVAGLVLFGLGVIGIVVPLMPTTIFWIVAAICFGKASPAMQQRIYEYPRVGPIVRDYVEEGALQRSSKIAALIGIAVVFTISAALLATTAPRSVIITGLILVPVCLFIATRPAPKATTAAESAEGNAARLTAGVTTQGSTGRQFPVSGQAR